MNTDLPGMASLPAGYRPEIHDSLDSTNDEARRRAAAGAPEGTLIVARQQSGGRGRHGRSWISPPGNLYCSLLLRPQCDLRAAAQLSFVAAVALAEALETWLDGARIALKWPNDVLLDGAKLAGILLESTAGVDGRTEWLVLGIGVNVASHPQTLDRPATSLCASGVTGVAPDDVLHRLAAPLDAWHRRWRAQGFAPVRPAWRARAFGLGAPIRANLTAGTIEGIFEDLDAAGALLYRATDGERGRIEAGEVQFGA